MGTGCGVTRSGFLRNGPVRLASPPPRSRGSTGREKNDKLPPPPLGRPSTFLRVSGSKEQLLGNQAQEEQRREMLETVKQLTGALDSDRSSAEAEQRAKGKEAGELLPRGRPCLQRPFTGVGVGVGVVWGGSGEGPAFLSGSLEGSPLSPPVSLNSQARAGPGPGEAGLVRRGDGAQVQVDH